MKKNKHPDVNPIMVVFTDGSQRQMYSTMGKSDEMVKIYTESDPFNHPAWNPGKKAGVKKNSRASRFVDRYGDLE